MTAGARPRSPSSLVLGEPVAGDETLTPRATYAEEEQGGGLGGVELRLLHYFLAVAEELHFGAAARRLSIAQPALSNAIKVLETRLGVSLLKRTTRRVELTTAGELLLDRARRLLDAHAALLGEMAAQRRLEAGTVRLGYAGSFTGLLPAAAARTREIELLDLGPGSGLAALRAREVDAALVSSPLSKHDALASVLLGYSPRMLAIWSGHRLARGSRPRSVKGWSERHVGIRGDAPGWAEFWSPSGFYEQPPSELVGTLEQALELVAAGHGVTMVPAVAIGCCSRADVAYLPVRGQARVGIHLAWRRELGRSPLASLVPVLRATMYRDSEVELFDDLDWLTAVGNQPL